MKKKYLTASFTVEASIVTAIVIIVFAYMIRFSFDLRDSVFGNALLNEAVELYGHKSRSDDKDYESYGNERLKNSISGRNMSISIEQNKEGCIGRLYGQENIRTITDRGFSPQKTMRRITLIEGVLDRDK